MFSMCFVGLGRHWQSHIFQEPTIVYKIDGTLGIRVDVSSKNLTMAVVSIIYLTPQNIAHPSVLTSWMSSPSRKRTGFRVRRWSIRKVLGSLRARTIHLKIRDTMDEYMRDGRYIEAWWQMLNTVFKFTCGHQHVLVKHCLLCNFPAAQPSLLLQPRCEMSR